MTRLVESVADAERLAPTTGHYWISVPGRRPFVARLEANEGIGRDWYCEPGYAAGGGFTDRGLAEVGASILGRVAEPDLE